MIIDDWDKAESVKPAIQAKQPPIDWHQLLRFWPLAAYCLFTLLLAFYYSRLTRWLEIMFEPLMGRYSFTGGGFSVGASVGIGAFLIVTAGFCGRSPIRAFVLCSLWAIAIFVLLHWPRPDYVVGTELLMQMISYAYNLPAMLLGAVLPVLLVRWNRRVLLASSPVQNGNIAFTIEQAFLWMTVVACIFYFCRVPMHINNLHFSSVAVYLPGMMLFSALATVLLVLPSIRWAFLPSMRLADWTILVVLMSLTSLLIFGGFTVLLGDWSQLKGFRLFDYVMGIASVLALYIPGLVSLRACGFRWQNVSREYAEQASSMKTEELLRQDSRTSRFWTLVYFVFAMLTTLPVGLYDQIIAKMHDRNAAMVREANELGGDLRIFNNQVLSLKLNQRMIDRYLPEIPTYSSMNTLEISQCVVDQRVTQAIISAKSLNTLSLSDLELTEESLHALRGLRLMLFELTRVKTSIPALARFLASSTDLQYVNLRSMELTDDQFAELYQPHIPGWGLSDNRLTDVGLKTIWQNEKVGFLDFSNNPIDGSVFSLATPKRPLSLVVRNCPINDQAVATLVAQGSLQSIELGKSTLTAVALDLMMTNGVSVTLREGSYTSKQLCDVNPVASKAMFHLADPAVDGSFLDHWRNIPTTINIDGSSLGDEDFAKLLKMNNLPSVIALSAEITDQSLPVIAKINPTRLDLCRSKLTFKAMLNYPMRNTILVVEPGRFSGQEIQQLKQIYSLVFEQRVSIIGR